MKNLLTALVMGFFLSSVAIAGTGHSHDEDGGHSMGPISSEAAGSEAMKKVHSLAQAGKIDASWSGIKPSSVEQKTYAKGPEWVVIFHNTQVSDKTKQSLYLFYSLDGHYIAANYTGS